MQIQTVIRRTVLTQIACLATMPLKSPTHERPSTRSRSNPKKGSFKRPPLSSPTGPVHLSRIPSGERGMILAVMKRLRSRSKETGVVKRSEFLDTCQIVAGTIKGNKIANRCIRQGLVLPYGDQIYLSFKRIEQDLQNRLNPSRESLQDFLQKKQEKLEKMEDTKKRMDALVKVKTKRLLWLGLTAWVAQCVLYYHLTYVRFSWDVMEPVTYMTTSFVIILLLVYCLQSRKLNFYQNMMNSYRERERKRFYKLAAFDLEEYTKLKDEIDLFKRMHSLRLK